MLNRPLNGWQFPCKAQDSVLPEAYADDVRNCVIRQLAALFEEPYDVIAFELNDLWGIKDGVSAALTLEWCKKRCFNCYVVWNDCLVAKHDAGEDRRHVHSVALQIVGGHAVIHKCCKSFAHMRLGDVKPLCTNSLTTS